MEKSLTVWIKTNCGKFFKRWKYQLTLFLRNLYAVQEATIGTRHSPTDWFKIGKGVQQGLYCHSAYLTYRQSTDCEMPGWMNDKLELRFLREIPTISDIEMITL